MIAALLNTFITSPNVHLWRHPLNPAKYQDVLVSTVVFNGDELFLVKPLPLQLGVELVSFLIQNQINKQRRVFKNMLDFIVGKHDVIMKGME